MDANARIGIGKAAYYPDVSLTGTAGVQGSSLAKLLSASVFFWSLGGNAAQTLVDFGARRATVRQYEAEYNAAVANYRETVLNAFKEVEDYLVATRTLAEQGTGRSSRSPRRSATSSSRRSATATASTTT